jgi:dienelactone hydrolase
MRIIGFLIKTIFVLVLLAVGGLAAIWYFNPFAPAILTDDPMPTGRRISEGGLVANYFPGTGDGRHAGVLMLGGSEGGLSPGVTRMAKELQSRGYSVLHVSYFGGPGQPGKLALIPLETFDRGLAWLKAQPDVDASRIAVLGGSKGGEAALIVAARHPEIKAVVAGMPSHVAWQGIDFNFMNFIIDPPGGSWTLNGRVIPFVPYTQDFRGGALVELYTKSLDQAPNLKDAVIRIELTRAPVLLICGKQDTLWPSCLMADRVKERAVQMRGPEVTVLAYENAGHAVLGIPLDKANKNYDALDSLGGTDDGNNAARADGWAKIVVHLEAALTPVAETLPR